jgi:hypothetical protein
MNTPYAVPDHDLARAVDGVTARYDARLRTEILEPLLQDLRVLELTLQRDLIESLPRDRSIETIEWFAQNARTLVQARLRFTRLAAGDPSFGT